MRTHRRRVPLLVAVLVTAATAATSVPAQAATEPVYTAGTAPANPDIITDADPTLYGSVRGLGDDRREVWDMRNGRFVVADVQIYQVTFDDGDTTEVLTTAGFTSAQGRAEAVRYGLELGRIPATIRRGVNQLVVNRGNYYLSASSGFINISTGRGAELTREGLLAETLMHEATHAAFRSHDTAAEWKRAQQADPTFISEYARDYPTTEDVAESTLLVMALRYRPDRLDAADRAKIRAAIPNRIAYLAGLGIAPPTSTEPATTRVT
ncbi:MAG: hypothetical protein ACRCXL_01965 [Dermatophilaceae bacterium]